MVKNLKAIHAKHDKVIGNTDRLPETESGKLVTKKQLTRMWTIASKNNWDKKMVHKAIGEMFALESTKELSQDQFYQLIQMIQGQIITNIDQMVLT